MTNQAFSRRSFLTGLATAGIAGWVYDSNSIGARVIRGTFNDAEREVVRLAAPDLSSWSDKTVDVCWIGHATVLINFFGLNVITDPVFSDRVGAQFGGVTVGRKRLISPALKIDALPRIDLALISHAHMDHMDLASLARLPKNTSVLTAPNTSDLLANCGFSAAQELRWNEKATLHTIGGEIEIQAVEVKHWGARWGSDTYRGYVGYLLKRGGKTLLFGGDTALTSAFENLKGSKVDAVLMPIGSYGRDARTHCTPEQAVRMVDACGADYIIPIHHSTLPIGMEPIEEPLSRLEQTISADRIALKTVGQTWRLPA